MKLNTSWILKLLISLLLIPSILGCASSVAQPPKQESLGASKALPIRVIITFNRLPVANDPRLLPLLAEACNCTPVFFRQFLDNALIYEISLPRDMTYHNFRKILLERGGMQGVRGVEQDILMHPQ